MRKLTYILLLVLLGAPTLASAAFDDATLSTGTILTVGGVTLNITGSNAVVESITVGTDSFTFVLLSGSSIQVTSPDRKVMTTDASRQFVLTNTCNSSESVLKHGGYTGSGSLTITVTPSSSTCTGGAATTATAGGGGVLASCNPGYQLSGAVCVPVAAAPTAPAVTPSSAATAPQPTVSATFTVNLTYGMSSDDVRRLQLLLARDSALYPEGTVSGYFGPKTREAVRRFQLKYGVASAGDTGFGSVGPKTRAKLQEVFGSKTAPPAQIQDSPSVSSSGISTIFETTLRAGMQSADVRRLQEILARDPEIYPEATVTGYYGPLTKKAVGAFQLKYGIVSSQSDPGYGILGPQTRAKLQQVFIR